MRLYAFDTINGWITTNYNILKQESIESEDDNNKYLNTLQFKLENIYKIIESNWEHRSRAISFIIETMYSKYIQLMDKYTDNNSDIYWMEHVEHAMSLSVGEKGKYLRLKVLLKRVGSLKLFEKYPNWIMMLLEASCIVGGNAISLVQESLNLAKQEISKNHDKKSSKSVIMKWRELWMDSVCKGFVHQNESVRKATNIDLLKYIVRSDPTSYFPLIQYILKSNKSLQSMWQTTTLRALIGILRSGKRNGTITNKMVEQWLEDTDDNDNDNDINKNLIFKCLMHCDWQIRLETLEIICASKLSTDIPGINQLELLQLIMPYWMKLQLSKHRDQFVQLIQKLLLRMKNGCYKILHETHKKMEKYLQSKISDDNDDDNDNDDISSILSLISNQSEKSSISLFKQWNDILHENNDYSQKIFNEIDTFDQDKIINCLDFIEWFKEFLLNNLYPAGPVERHSICITLYYFLLQIWGQDIIQNNISNNNDNKNKVSLLNKKACKMNENDKIQYNILQIPLLINDEYVVNILLNSMMNGWDQVRLLSHKILQLLPSPLPGYQTEISVIRLLRRCLVLTSSPRLLESDCGALLLSIIFNKYVKQLNWSFDLLTIFNNYLLSTNSIHSSSNLLSDSKQIVKIYKNKEEAILSFLDSFGQILSRHISIISIIPFHKRYRSPHHRVHGLLSFFREILPNLNLKSKWKSSYKLHQKWKDIFSNILKNIFEIGEISLILHTRNPKQRQIENPTNLSSDGDIKSDTTDNVKLLGIDCRGHMTFSGLTDYADQQMEQMIVVSSWLGVKESCLCLAKFIENCPLPQPKQSEITESKLPETTINLVDIENIQKIGAFFLKTLQTTRHNGVMEKSHAGFTILCRCLLGSGKKYLKDIVHKWLDELLNIVKNEAGEHWIRRSAGFPFTFLAILQAESKVIANDHQLFKYTMNELLIEAKKDDTWQSKVVSLNIIMFIFQNSSFGLSVMRFVSEAFQIVLPGFSHKQWAVRNSSMLCLTAIISRAIRKSDNVMKIENIKKQNENVDLQEYIDTNNEENEFFENGLLLPMKYLYSNNNDRYTLTNTDGDKTAIGTTAEIFFNQHPSLHSFLLQHLDDATKDDSNLHPSLFPVLLLLSKLTPRQNESVNDPHGLSAFKSHVIKCASHKYQRVRIMSARALVSLVSKQNLIPFLNTLIQQIPNKIQSIKSMNQLHGLLLQIQYILQCCYKYIPLLSTDLLSTDSSCKDNSIWIIDAVLPILIQKLWLLNSIYVSSIIQQALIIICISVLHRILMIQHNDYINLSSKQSQIVMAYLMTIYKSGLTVLSNNSNTKNDIHSTRYSITRQSISIKHNKLSFDFGLLDIANSNVDDQSESDPEFYRKIKEELEQGINENETGPDLDIGERRLRSFASKLLIESLLLSPNGSMNKLQLTQLICVMLKDSDELVVQSTANCLCSIINHYKSQKKDELIINKINWSEILIICMNLMKWSLWLGRRLASVIQLFNNVIEFNHKYIEYTSIQSLWNILYQIASNNSHFVVQIAAMQSLGTVISILFTDSDNLGDLNQQTVIGSILKNWIIILNKFSDEDSAEELRSVCVSSIETSNILKPIHYKLYKQYEIEIVDIWLIMIRLLQDFEMPIRNIASKSISFLFLQKESKSIQSIQSIQSFESSFLPNYCMNVVFKHLQNTFMSINLLNKLLDIIIHPNVWYTSWLLSNDEEYKLFLPERPNDSFEPLLTMQMATKILLQYVKCNNNYNIIDLINNDVINGILSDLQQITDIHLSDNRKDDDNKHLMGKVVDAQIQLVWSIWMIHWFSLLYCYQIISTSMNDNQQRYKLCAFVMSKLKSELQKVRSCYDSITINFCDKTLQILSNSNDYETLSFLC